MKVLSSNYRGLGSPSAVLQCQKKAQKYKLDIIFLMETKLPKTKKLEFWKNMVFGMDGRFLKKA